jgi:putative transposase
LRPAFEKERLNSKLHTVCDGDSRPVRLLLTAGDVNDIKGAAKLLENFPATEFVLVDKGYDADWFRRELQQHGVVPCIPLRCNRKIQVSYDVTLYRRRHKIEDMFGRLKDWHPIAIRYDRCVHSFFSSICITCSFLFYFNL